MRFGNRVSLFFWFLGIGALGAVVFYVPKEYQKPKDIEALALMSVEAFSYRIVDSNGTRSLLEARRADHFETYDVVHDATISHLKEPSKGYDVLQSRVVYKRGEHFDFSSGLTYSRSDGMELWSESGIYDSKQEIFDGKGPFVLENSAHKTKGIDLHYDKKNQSIVAKNVWASLEIKGKSR